MTDAHDLAGFEHRGGLPVGRVVGAAPAWVSLVPAVAVLNNASYTVNVATPTAIDISAVVPNGTTWIQVTLEAADTGGPGGWFGVGDADASLGFKRLTARPLVANTLNGMSGWIPVVNGQIYYRLGRVGTMTVYLFLYDYIIG